MTAHEVMHSIAPHDARDPVVTWVVALGTERVGSGIPTLDAAVAFALDHLGQLDFISPRSDVLEQLSRIDLASDGWRAAAVGSALTIDGQRIAFIPFALRSSQSRSRADGMILPELRCRDCRRTL